MTSQMRKPLIKIMTAAHYIVRTKRYCKSPTKTEGVVIFRLSQNRENTLKYFRQHTL